MPYKYVNLCCKTVELLNCTKAQQFNIIYKMNCTIRKKRTTRILRSTEEINDALPLDPLHSCETNQTHGQKERFFLRAPSPQCRVRTL